ncbi:phytanoyl-CoA dioxygenase family protein [Caulobacter mirabilis]|uniref:Phytanoyl-CoA dioxygenase n=1 Tax=Caulobacter mirabilis TaxID=69666 RepID=A0A2D2B1B5_9CAUL|nr:phytanoyl-CoA dioxygenase family protein [Caulobacter mirabilis]ATQ44054.1 phytanoyl-CoA dioxygenase [Caulobacter mirabilis]
MQDAVRKAFLEDGAVVIKGCLNEAQLAQCRAAFDWAVDNPGPHATKMYKDTGQRSHVDNCNPLAKPRLDELVASLPFGALFADIWGSANAWYFAEEIFLKEGGVGARTLWHQDTSYLPWAGLHWGNAWISFESVPKQNALEIVRGSHRGPQYDGTTFVDPNDPTDPLHGGDVWPRLPDVEAERRVNPGAHDILSWATEPGDVLLLHPGSLHGGAPVDAAFPDRHTLVLRFFGDDATYRPLPDESRSGYQRTGVLFREEMEALTPGAPFRSPVFRQVA